MLRPTASAEHEWHPNLWLAALGKPLPQHHIYQHLRRGHPRPSHSKLLLFQAQTRGSMSVDTPETML